MRARLKIPVAMAGIALLFAASMTAGEKVQFQGSTSISLPKPTRTLEDGRNSRLPESASGQGEYETGMGHVSPPVMTTPQTDKKLKEFLDKKKNWIFVNPYENQYDAKTEEFMKGDKATGLSEHRLLKEEEKGVMERFLDERNPRREEEMNSEERGRESEHGPNGDGGRFNDRSAERANNRPELAAENLNNQKSGDTKALTFSSDQKTPLLFQQGTAFDPKSDRPLFNDRPKTDRPDRSLSKEELRKERDTRDAEITRMLQPRGASPGIASRFDPVNSTDTTRQEASPIGGRRTDGFLNSSRPPSTVGGISPVGNGPIFSGASAPSSLANRSSFDFGAKAGPSVGSGLGSSPLSSAAAASRPTVNAKPFVLPLPQRKF